jgi:hypothetical protein
VTLSSSGLIVRLVAAGGTRTLTAWSGPHGRPALHPVLPWLAVPRSRSLVEVADLATGRLLRRFEEDD